MAQTLVVHHRRHRPVRRHDLHPHQLPGFVAGRRRRRPRPRSASSRCWSPASSAAPSTALIVIYGQAAADRHDDRHRRDLFRHRAATAALPRRLGQRGSGRCADRPPVRRGAGEPGRAARSSCWSSGCRSAARSRGAPPMRPARSKPPPTCPACRSARGKFVAYALAGLLAAIGGLFLTFFTYTGEAAFASGNAYTLFSIAAVVLGGVSLFGGTRQRHRRDLRRAGLPHHRRPAVRLRFRPAVAAAVPGRRAADRRQPRLVRAVPRAQQAGVVPMSDATVRSARRLPAFLRARRSGGGHRLRLHPAAAAARQPLFDELPVARISAAAAQGRLLPRRDRDRA